MKSFYGILKEGRLEVKHGSGTVNLELPDWFVECEPHLESVPGMQAWADKHNIALGLFHAAIQKVLINMRQEVRPKNLSKAKGGGTQKIIEEHAQAELDIFTIDVVPRPGESKAAEKAQIILETTTLAHANMRTAMLDTGMTEDEVDALFDKI